MLHLGCGGAGRWLLVQNSRQAVQDSRVSKQDSQALEPDSQASGQDWQILEQDHSQQQQQQHSQSVRQVPVQRFVLSSQETMILLSETRGVSLGESF